MYRLPYAPNTQQKRIREAEHNYNTMVTTIRKGGIYKLDIVFGADYPTKAPECKFNPVIYHPNVYPSGKVCLSILDNNKDWKPSITLKQIVLGVQDLLNTPNNSDPAQQEASSDLKRDKQLYINKVKEQAKKYAPT